MIPAFNPDEAYLRQALGCVLAQDEGPGRMEVVVVDDASPAVDTAAMVRRIGGDRIRCEVQQANRGLAGNWNRCVELAQGEWLHILHQDDLVRPGFYQTMERLAAQCPEAVAMFCRHEMIGPQGETLSVSVLERPYPGVLEGFVDRIFVSQRIQCPSIVVRRSTYEQLGPFRSDLPYVLDWDMWKRIAAFGPVAYTPEVLAAYRVHDGSETARLKRADRCFSDILRSAAMNQLYLPGEAGQLLTKRAKAAAVDGELSNGWRLLMLGERKEARRSAYRLFKFGIVNGKTVRFALCALRGH